MQLFHCADVLYNHYNNGIISCMNWIPQSQFNFYLEMIPGQNLT